MAGVVGAMATQGRVLASRYVRPTGRGEGSAEMSGRGQGPMSVDEFWELISLTGGRVDEVALQPLGRALNELSAERMTEFGDHFRTVLAALDTEAHLRQPVRDVDDPPGAALPMTGGDVFLYARCSVVGAGRAAWEAVVADPAAFAARPWQMAEGEMLLALVENAYDERTGEMFELEPRDCENPDWFHTGYGFDIKVPDPAPSRWAHLAFCEALNADAAWREWWMATGRRELWLYPLITPNPTGDRRIRRRKKTVDIEIELDSRWRHRADPQQLADETVREIQDMIRFAAAHMKLPPHPAWPQIGPVPDDLSEYDSVEDDLDVPVALREAFLQMGMAPKDVDGFLGQIDVGER